MVIHINYEQADEYPLTYNENSTVSMNWHVEKLRLAPDKKAVRVNEWLTLTDIPSQCFQYQLGERSALEWIIDQYTILKDPRSGILIDPNKLEDERCTVSLICKIVSVSLETVELAKRLNQTVSITELMDIN